jgi:type IV pilus assembly protein PilC
MSDVVILDEIVDEDLSIDSSIIWSNESLLERINNYFLKSQKIWIKEKIVFYRLLSTMLNAWMSLMKWVEVLERQEKNKVFKLMLWWFLTKLKEWDKLSECLDENPKSFDKSEIWVIKSWEKTWKLNDVLTGLAEQIEKVASISWKLKSAMIYPAMVLLVVFWVIAIMMTMVVPKLLEIFDNKSALPQSTQTLIMISDLFRYHWYYLIGSISFIIIWVSIWKKTARWKYLYDRNMLKIPIFWWIIQKVVLSKFSRVFSWLISSWVSIVESLKIVSEAVWNEVYRQRILLLKQDVKWWMKIWESLDGDKLFPDMMIQMIQVWEQAAKLDQTIVKVADFYDEQVDNTIWAINKLLEPFIIVTLAVVVWFIAIAIMQPIMNLADTISQT